MCEIGGQSSGPDEAMSAIATAAASTVVGAMASAGWDAVRGEVVRLWHGHTAPDRDAVVHQLDRAAELVASATDKIRARDQVAAVLTVELLRHLVRHPEHASELERLAAATGPAGPSHVQHNSAAEGGQVFAVQHGDLYRHVGGNPPRPPGRTGDDSERR